MFDMICGHNWIAIHHTKFQAMIKSVYGNILLGKSSVSLGPTSH